MFRSKGLATSPLSTSHESPQEEAEVEFQRSCHQEEERRQSAGAAGLHVCCEFFYRSNINSIWKDSLRSGGPRLKQTQRYPADFGKAVAGHHIRFLAWFLHTNVFQKPLV